MYKTVSTLKNDTWDNISRRLYGTPERSGDIEKLNNGNLSDKVVVYDTEENSQNTQKEVTLVVNDVIYNDIPESCLIDNLEGCKGGVFVFLPDKKEKFKIKNGSKAKIYHEKGEFLTGYVANVRDVFRRNICFKQVEVKSWAGILLDTILPPPLEFTNSTIESVLTRVLSYYGQSIDLSDVQDYIKEINSNEIGTSFTANANETVFDFLSRICRSRGLILTDTGDGLKVIKIKPDTEKKLYLIEGETVGLGNIRANFNTDGLARYYEIHSQYPSTASATITTPYPIPITKMLHSDDINSNNINEVAQRLVCMEIAKHYPVEAELSDNLSIITGDVVGIKQPSVNIDDLTDFVVSYVERINPDTLFLQFKLMCGYTGVLPDKLPNTE